MKGGKRNENLTAKEAMSTELQKLQEESNCFPWLHFDSRGGGGGGEIKTEVTAPDKFSPSISGPRCFADEVGENRARAHRNRRRRESGKRVMNKEKTRSTGAAGFGIRDDNR